MCKNSLFLCELQEEGSMFPEDYATEPELQITGR